MLRSTLRLSKISSINTYWLHDHSYDDSKKKSKLTFFVQKQCEARSCILCQLLLSPSVFKPFHSRLLYFILCNTVLHKFYGNQPHWGLCHVSVCFCSSSPYKLINRVVASSARLTVKYESALGLAITYKVICITTKNTHVFGFQVFWNVSFIRKY